jgi:hypothetical protein
MVRKIGLNESGIQTDIDYYVKRMNDSFDENISAIRKYVSDLASLKDDILLKLNELKTSNNSMYVQYKLNELDATISGIGQSRSLIDNAEFKAEEFIDDNK